ncbi:hypothetical protein [Ruegeria sp.]|uniref:hypothetical protein n=1 Tax=Ruegeria sp. TaxID=1879320 RepID=UPI003B597B40
MQVIIHAGAAFTDDGRLLASLQKNAAALTEGKLSIFGPRRYRQVFKPAFDQLETGIVDTAEFEKLRNFLPDSPTDERAVFSSESFPGELSSALREGQLYPFAGRRMALLEDAFPNHQIELFIGLRNPGSFIPKLLMSLPQETRGNIIRDTDLSCLSWIGMIEDIRDLAPGVQLTIWRNEDTPFIWGDIIRAMGGLKKEAALPDENDLLLSLLDEMGQGKLRALVEQGADQDIPNQHDAMAQIFHDHAQHDAIEEELDLPGWSTEIVDAFSELYEQDMARLAKMSGVRMLEP